MASVQRYEDGQLGVLDVLTDLRQSRQELETALEIIKGFEDEYLEEIELAAKAYGGTYKGWAIEVRQGRKIYDFSKIKDIKIAKANLKELEDYYKEAFEARQKFMIADNDGAEIDLPEVKYAKPSVIVRKAND